MCLKLTFSACHGADTGVSRSDLYLMAHFVCGGGTKTTQCGKVLGAGLVWYLNIFWILT